MTDWGFDLTTFKSDDDFRKLLKRHGISATPVRKNPVIPDHPAEYKHEESGWIWSGRGIKLVTANNPLSGEYYRKNPDGSPYRQNEKGYASYIGISGDDDKVLALAKDIRKTAGRGIKDESKHTRDFI